MVRLCYGFTHDSPGGAIINITVCCFYRHVLIIPSLNDPQAQSDVSIIDMCIPIRAKDENFCKCIDVYLFFC